LLTWFHYTLPTPWHKISQRYDQQYHWRGWNDNSTIFHHCPLCWYQLAHKRRIVTICDCLICLPRFTDDLGNVSRDHSFDWFCLTGGLKGGDYLIFNFLFQIIFGIFHDLVHFYGLRTSVYFGLV
jgi:hypothetical protein